jgi:hypothetical protein
MTLKVGMLLLSVMSLGSNHKLKEVVGDKGPLDWVLKLERVEIHLPPLEGGKVVLNIEEFHPLFPLGNPGERESERDREKETTLSPRGQCT